MTETLATLIVVTYNSRRWLARLRAALELQTEQRWRLIVVDNASARDQRPEMGDLPQRAALLQQETNLGFAAANNLAARGATTPYLVLLNPDAFPEPEWLEKLIAAAEQYQQAGAIGSTQISANDPSKFDGAGDVMHASGIAYRAEYGKPLRQLGPIAETFSACGAAMLVRREAFEALGGFDERYFSYFEDVDLGFRLRLAGWRVLQTPDAVVAHIGGASAGAGSSFAEFHGARNRLWTFFKCMPALLLWLLLPAHLVGTFLLASVGPFRGRGLHAWRGIASGFAGLGPILETRRHIQKARKAQLGDLAAAFAWAPDVFFTRRAVHRKIRG